MFRKMAIALVAASVFTAPVLAQNNPLAGGGTTSTPSTDTTEKAKQPEKTEKSAEATTKSQKAAKAATRHHRTAARHHRHGTKAAKYGKGHTATAMSGKHDGAKTAKVEGRRTGHGRTLPKHAYGKASKHTPSKTMTQPSTR